MRRVISILLMALIVLPSTAQNLADVDAVTEFIGAGSEDELDPYEVERLQDLLQKPLPLNYASASRMMSSGLLSAYQIASLNDYRKRSGDVLSFSELEAVDGFNEDVVRRIAPFVTLESSGLTGKGGQAGLSMSNDLAVRTAYKWTGDRSSSWNYAMKYRLEAGERLSAAVAVSRPYDAPDGLPATFSGHLAWNFRRHSAKIVIGDFNARFGQGLSFWNGMVLSGLSSPSAFIRRATGISQSWSFTGSSSLTGLASSAMFGKLGFSAAMAVPGMTVVNATLYGKNGQLSFTNFAQFTGLSSGNARIPELKTSVDAGCCISGTDVFAEASYDWVNQAVAALAGVSFPAGDDMRMASMLRYYPPGYSATMSAAPRSGTKCSNECSASISGEAYAGDHVSLNGAEGFGSSVRRHKSVFSLDATRFPESRSESISVTWQMKALISWEIMLAEWLRMTLRINERLRNWEENRLRTDVRVELDYISRHILAACRFNVMKTKSAGMLGYMEAGYRKEMLTVYLRQGFFSIDNWEDRIYVYERDAPGSFNVPAYYGRGFWTAFTASWKFSRWGRLYARVGLTAYPFMDDEIRKPGKAELKLQYVFAF